VEYDERRPHSALAYQTPAEFACRSKFGLLSALLPSKLAKSNRTSFYSINQPAELHLYLSSVWGQATSVSAVSWDSMETHRSRIR
jgi:hypothetical protein